MKNGKTILNDFFETFDIKYVFGNPGTTETTFLDVVSSNKNCRYILGLNESTATGIAAGYAVKSGKTAILNIHTYPGLANSLSNLYNAYASGIPIVVIAGQQNRQHLIHEPILSGNLVELAKTATVMQYEIHDVAEMNIALQRAYLEATEAKAPTFLSIPMEIYSDECKTAYFKPTKLVAETKAADLNPIIELISSHQGKKIIFVADAELIWSPKSKEVLTELVGRLNCDVYLAPFSLNTVINVHTPNYKGILPAISDQANKVLSSYELVILLGEKIQSFLFKDKPTLPASATVVQFSTGHTKIRYDYPFDYVVRGDIHHNLLALLSAFKHLPLIAIPHDKTYSGTKTLLFNLLQHLPKDKAVIIEGSSHQTVEEKIVYALEFQEVYFEPRGGSLGWAMPMAVGISLHSQQHTICLFGDGGSIFSIPSIWTAAHYQIPVIFICVINHEYKILKQLWRLQIPSTKDSEYIGLDITHPQLDLLAIAKGFGATVAPATDSNYKELLEKALKFKGPTFITVMDDREY